MRNICFVSIAQEGLDVAAIFEPALQNMKFDVEIVRIPHFFLSDLTNDRLFSLKKLLKKKSSDAFVIFFPDTAELFLQEADLMLVFSAYRSWFSQNTMRVIPHMWTPVGLPENVKELTWTEKPPIQIGFMGRSHETSTLANVVLKSPTWIKDWLLQGRFLQYPKLIAQLNEFGISTQFINTFSRIETIKSLRAKGRNYNIAVDFAIVEERHNFVRTEHEMKKDYKNHLKKNTYIICPRGSENYSFRIYEALNFGRIPVILDTDVVLPKEINWDRLSIIVPYKSMQGLYDAIVQDYEFQICR